MVNFEICWRELHRIDLFNLFLFSDSIFLGQDYPSAPSLS